MGTHPPTPLLIASGIDKTFDRTRALDGAELAVARGEVHALLGANGAGKSTLSRVIGGHVRRDAGSLTFAGRALDPRTPREALRAGIAMVMQETSMAPDLTVLENIFLPEFGERGPLSYPALRRRARGVLEQLGQADSLNLDAAVRDLSAAGRQLVEIARALALDAALIIFDEPTASLSPGEVERLFDVMGRLRDAGHALVFVSHRLEEVFAITDRVTVLREGRTVAASLPTAALTQAELVRLMVGQEIEQVLAASRAATPRKREPILQVQHLSAPPAVRDVSFTLHRGEILGLGGLVGAGRSETVEAIFGLRPRAGGEMHLRGAPFAPRRPADAVRAGIGLVPEDRRGQSIVPDFSVRENLLLAHLSAHRGVGRGYGTRAAAMDDLLHRLGLPSHRRLDASMLTFSGGMQQKVILARWLLLDPDVLILDEPTKGVDIGTRNTIYAMLREVAARGTAILVVSSDFEELLGLAERIVVISDGASIADMPSAVLDEEKLTLFAAPRSSMERNAAVLRRITAELGGAAFWVLLDGERAFCLNAAIADPAADPGLRAGAALRFDETHIPAALAARTGGFVTDAASHRAGMLVQVHSHRGHDLGWIGVSVPASHIPADTDAVRARIRTLFAESV